MNYIILDMEWNQPMGKAKMVTKPVPLYGEIIRIGAVKLDSELKELSKNHLCVIPKYYKTMNASVGKVTGLANRAITYGLKFSVAFEMFMKWCGEDCAILTWGGEDEKILRSNMALHGISDENLPAFYDLQVIFDSRIACDSRQYGISAALEYYGLPADLKAHDALNDAIYTARIGRKMDFPRYLLEYDALINDIMAKRAERLQKYVRIYENVPADVNVYEGNKFLFCRCPACRRIMKRKQLVMDGTMAMTVASCTDDGEYFVTLSRQENGKGAYTVTKRVTRITDEQRELYSKCVSLQNK